MHTYKNLAVKELKKKGKGKKRKVILAKAVRHLSETKTHFFIAATFGFGSKRAAQLFLQNTFCSDPL